ncbi:hypothetical protein R5R35_000542 [Gryllus longicercus]|uniref:Microtubule-associated protein 9 n=1 Tax=Gryllus longicercus TaxID=2509291 RepID=A0AAN9VX37_9ORTH
MTRTSISDSRPQSRNGSICSEDEKASSVVGTPEKKSEKTSASSSEKSGATYTKDDSKFTILRSLGEHSNAKLTSKLGDPVLQRPISNLRHLRGRDGILEPALLTSKHGQWLAWNDPVFTRRRSIEEQRLCKRLATPTEQKSTVTSFKRSLQLLGLKESDLGLNCVKTKSNEIKIQRGRATPTFSTQLKQRSVSLTNLRNAVQESGLPTVQAIEKMHRDILTRAVYEEWYFRKQTESRVRKELEEEVQRKREQEIEWIKLEKKQRAEENFEKWKKRKAQLHKEQQKEANNKGAKPSPYAKEKPGGDKAFDAWKAKKDEEIKAKINIKKKLVEEEKNKKDKEEKKAAAQAAFRAWKQQVDEELKKHLKEKEREKKKEEEKKEEEAKVKRENAKACFMKWKTDKDKEIKESLKMKRSKSKQRAEEITTRKKEREYEAAQAFEEWLDQVEEREDKKINSKNSLKDDVPPWYPV